MSKTQTMGSSTARLEAAWLGAPSVRLAGHEVRFRTRKTLALLVYLTLEPGLHSRGKLIALLWPESDEGAGRALLRSTLAYLKGNLGGGHRWLLTQNEGVGLNPAIPCGLDVNRLNLAFRATAQSEASPDLEAELEQAARLCRGELLEGFGLPDAPAFDDWLIAQREVVRGWLDAVLERLGALYAASGRPNLALEVAQRRARVEPLSEAAHRSVIELHLRSGNRTAALEAYQACRDMLERELGLEPDAATRALLEPLHTSGVTPAPPVASISGSLEHPPTLAGRSREWAALEAGWKAGKIMVVAGEPGVGKSRLLEDFAASHGRFTRFQGRPGDASAPFSSLARLARQALEPEPALEAWVRRELSRLIPELEPEPPEPMRSEEDRLRFFEAITTLLRGFSSKCAAFVVDDLQFMDPGSAAWLGFWTSRDHAALRTLIAYRRNELSVDGQRLVQDLLDSERGRAVMLERLDASGLHELLSSLNLPGLERLSTMLHQFTGGNPLFLLETIRTLSERGSLGTMTAEQFENRRRVANLPRSPRVEAIIGRRLERLSERARDLSRVAAVAGTQFSLALGAQVLETNALELARASEELEAAQVWHGIRFSHDLLFETTLAGIPASVGMLLHHRVLMALESGKAPVAALAHHALVAQQWAKAVHYSVAAAIEADYNLEELRLEHCERAMHLLRQPPEGFDPATEVSGDDRLELYYCFRAAFQTLSRYDEDEAITVELREYARRIGDARLEIRTLLTHGNEQRLGHQRERELLLEAVRLVEQLQDRNEWVNVQTNLLHHEFINAEYPAALARSETVLPVARALYAEAADAQNLFANPLFECLRMTAQANLWSGHWEDAFIAEREVENLLRPFPMHRTSTANCQLWLSVMLLNLGRLEESLPLGRMAFETNFELSPNVPYSSVSSFWHGIALLDHGDFSAGLEVFTRGFELVSAPNTDVFYSAGMFWLRGYALHLVGQLAPALDLVLEALSRNEEQAQRNAWGMAMQEHYANCICTIHALQDNWDQAFKYAMLAAQGRSASNNESGSHTPRMRRDLEIEALLRGGEVDLARASVHRLGAATEHYARRKIPYLRGLAALEAWEGKLESAIQHLEVARDLMVPIGLPNERWTLEVNLAGLYEQNGDPEKAQEARATALEVINSLATKIADETMRETFLGFAHSRLTAQTARNTV